MRKQLFSIIILSALSVSASAQTLQVITKGETKDFEGNKVTLPGKVTLTEYTEDIVKVTFYANKMELREDGFVLRYKINDIDRVSLAGNVNKLDIFYPQSISNAFNFETAVDDLLDADYSAGKAIDDFVEAASENIVLSASNKDITLAPTVKTKYIVTGEADEASITIQGNAEAMILLSSAKLKNTAAPAIVSTSDANIYIATEESTVNELSAISASGNIYLSGKGVLKIVNTADNLACIRSSKEVFINGGTLNIFNSGYAGQGIYADRNVTINKGALNIITTGDGTAEDTKLAFTAGVAICAGIAGEKNDGKVNINGGKIRIKAIGGEGAAGIAAMHKITAKNATILVSAFDDGFNAIDGIETEGCYIFVTSAVDDAVGSSGSLTFRGGILYAAGPYPSESAFDNNGKNFAIEKDITMIGVGSRGDAPMSSKATVPYINIKCSRSGNTVSGGIVTQKYIVIKDASDKEVLAFIAPVYSGGHALVVASPKMQKGAEYTIYTTDTCTSGTETFGLITNGHFENLTKVSTATAAAK